MVFVKNFNLRYALAWKKLPRILNFSIVSCYSAKMSQIGFKGSNFDSLWPKIDAINLGLDNCNYRHRLQYEIQIPNFYDNIFKIFKNILPETNLKPTVRCIVGAYLIRIMGPHIKCEIRFQVFSYVRKIDFIS